MPFRPAARWTPVASALCAAALLLAAPAAHAQAAAHAHVHGQMTLGIAVDPTTLTLALDAPLDSLLGFEHPPRTEAEKRAAQQLLARLRAPEGLFKIDPAAGCKPGPVTLESAALGLGPAPAPGAADDGHAELAASFSFDCPRAAQARFIDTQLFATFAHTRQITVEIATPQGQFKRVLKRPAGRIEWGR